MLFRCLEPKRAFLESLYQTHSNDIYDFQPIILAQKWPHCAIGVSAFVHFKTIGRYKDPYILCK